MTALEQSIVALCDQHNLLSFSITYYRADHRNWFGASCQWADERCSQGRGVATGDGDDIAEALSRAIEKMAAKRAVTLADEALPVIA